MSNENDLSPLKSPENFPGDQKGYCEHIKEEIDYLISALEELDRARELHYTNTIGQKQYNYALSDVRSVPEEYGGDPHLDERAERALKIVMDYFVWQYGKQLGVDIKSRQYLRFSDMSADDMFRILSGHLPELYRKIGFNMFKRMQSGEFLRALFVSHETPKEYESELTGVLSYVRERHSKHSGIIPEYEVEYKFNKEAPPKERHFSSNRENKFPMDLTQPSSESSARHQYISLSLVTARPHTGEEKKELLRNDKPYRDEYESNIIWKDCFAYQCSLNLACETIKQARFIKCEGIIEKSGLSHCLISVDKPLEIKQCEITEGKIEIKNVLKAESVFFHGTTLVLEQENKEVNFKLCDFSNAKIDDERDLLNIAKWSEKCFFSPQQIEILTRNGFKEFEEKGHQNAQEVSRNLESLFEADCDHLAGPEHEEILSTRNQKVIADLLNLERNKALNPDGDLADVPLFRTGGLEKVGEGIYHSSRQNRDEDGIYYADEVKKDLRMLFPVLGGAESRRLEARIKLFSELLTLENIENPQQILNFIQKGGEKFCEALGLHKEILKLKINFTDLAKHIEVGRRAQYNKQQIYVSNNIPLVLQTSEGKFVPSDIAFDGKRVILKRPPLAPESKIDPYSTDEEKKSLLEKGPFGTLPIYSQLQIIKRQLQVLGKRLSWYRDYLKVLLKRNNCKLPICEKNSNEIVLRGFHPNLLDILEERRNKGEKVPDKPVPQEIILTPNKKQIIAVSGSNAGGKTMTVGGILQNVAQAQAGAPSTGEVEVGLEGMYDHILYMSTEHARPGEASSGLQSRAEVIREFIKKIDSIAKKSQREKLPNILIGLDEIVMDATNPNDAQLIEENLIKHLRERTDINVTILLVSHHTQVIKNLKLKFPNTEILVPDLNQKYHFIEGNEPAISDPSEVFKDFGLEFLLKKDEQRD
ncbi:hypothetical protein K9M41_00165 [Candidatus Gracilibacteria bacterium]|nr:hypothetical protein [Candidatus Gracilibacteria bacterium]